MARRHSNQHKEKTGSRVVAQFILNQFNSIVTENSSMHVQIVCANTNPNQSLQAKPHLGKCCMSTLYLSQNFDITVAFQVDIKYYCSVHANKKILYTKQIILVHTKIIRLISVLGLALLDVQIQQWGTAGPQLMLLKWI